jgi:hypothetical protein
MLEGYTKQQYMEFPLPTVLAKETVSSVRTAQRVFFEPALEKSMCGMIMNNRGRYRCHRRRLHSSNIRIRELFQHPHPHLSHILDHRRREVFNMHVRTVRHCFAVDIIAIVTL